MNPKTLSTCLLIITLCLAAAVSGQAGSTADDLYKQAYTVEAVDRDPAKAIDLYKKVLLETADKDPLAARAHLRLGLCYEKLSRPSEARSSFQNVLEMGGDVPPSVVAQAREHLQRLSDAGERAAVSASGSADAFTAPMAWSNRWQASFMTGAAIPVGNDVLGIGNPSVSPLIQGSILFDLLPWLSFGPELGYSTGHTMSVDTPFDQIDYKVTIFQFTPEFQAGQWLRLGAVTARPYAVFGGGLYYTHETITDTPLFPFFLGPSVMSVEGSRANGGFNVGGGVSVKIRHDLAIGPDFRYHYIFGSGINFHYMTMQAQLSYFF